MWVMGWLAAAEGSDRAACATAARWNSLDSWVAYVLDQPDGRCTTQAVHALGRLGLEPLGVARAVADLRSGDPVRQVAARQWLLQRRDEVSFGAPPPLAPPPPAPPRPPPPTAAELQGPPANALRSESGLAWVVYAPGDGQRTGPDGRATVHYAGWSSDGTCFDDSWARGEPPTFPVNGVVAGFAEALRDMGVGEVRRVWIPPALGYGDAPRPGVPTGTLIFDVAVLGVQ